MDKNDILCAIKKSYVNSESNKTALHLYSSGFRSGVLWMQNQVAQNNEAAKPPTATNKQSVSCRYFESCTQEKGSWCADGNCATHKV